MQEIVTYKMIMNWLKHLDLRREVEKNVAPVRVSTRGLKLEQLIFLVRRSSEVWRKYEQTLEGP